MVQQLIIKMNRYMVMLLVALLIGAISYAKSGNSCATGATGADGNKPCHRAGCSGEICTDRDDIMTPCVWNECRNTCYNNHTTCKRIDGKCTFEEHSGFNDCISKCKN